MRRAGRSVPYSVDEAAEFLQFHPDTVRYWLRVGELSGIPNRDHDDWVIEQEDLVAFLRGSGEEVPVNFQPPLDDLSEAHASA